jgi:hypothetical protein
MTFGTLRYAHSKFKAMLPYLSESASVGFGQIPSFMISFSSTGCNHSGMQCHAHIIDKMVPVLIAARSGNFYSVALDMINAHVMQDEDTKNINPTFV